MKKRHHRHGLVSGIDGSPSTILIYEVTKRGPPKQHCIGRRSSIALRLGDDTPVDFVQRFDCTYLSYSHDDVQRNIDLKISQIIYHLSFTIYHDLWPFTLCLLVLTATLHLLSYATTNNRRLRRSQILLHGLGCPRVLSPQIEIPCHL